MPEFKAKHPLRLFGVSDYELQQQPAAPDTLFGGKNSLSGNSTPSNSSQGSSPVLVPPIAVHSPEGMQYSPGI